MLTYKTADLAAADRQQIELLLDALNASPSSIRRDEAGLWILRGSRGYCSSWGDGRTWALTVTPPSLELSKQAWTWIKKRLAFAEVTQDGDHEGVFRLHELPTAEQADVLRDVAGIRKRMEWTLEELVRRQEAGRRLARLKH